MLQRVLVRDRMPDSQRFLISLKDRHAELGTSSTPPPPLYHSERFILEAMDGYRVVEGPGVGPPVRREPGACRCWRGTRRPPTASSRPPDLDVLAESRASPLYGNSNLDLEATRLRVARAARGSTSLPPPGQARERLAALVGASPGPQNPSVPFSRAHASCWARKSRG